MLSSQLEGICNGIPDGTLRSPPEHVDSGDVVDRLEWLPASLGQDDPTQRDWAMLPKFFERAGPGTPLDRPRDALWQQ